MSDLMASQRIPWRSILMENTLPSLALEVQNLQYLNLVLVQFYSDTYCSVVPMYSCTAVGN